MNSLVAAVMWIISSVIIGAMVAIVGAPTNIWVMMTIMLSMLPVGVYAYTYAAPGMAANARRSNIDKRISYSMSFIAATHPHFCVGLNHLTQVMSSAEQSLMMIQIGHNMAPGEQTLNERKKNIGHRHTDTFL